FTLKDYERDGILTHKGDPLNRTRHAELFLSSVRGLSHSEVIQRAIAAKRNILVVGATGSGKTTFLNACFDAIARITPDDRVVSIEDTIELQSKVRNYVGLHATGGITTLDCLRTCMRLKPTRIVVGEVR